MVQDSDDPRKFQTVKRTGEIQGIHFMGHAPLVFVTPFSRLHLQGRRLLHFYRSRRRGVAAVRITVARLFTATAAASKLFLSRTICFQHGHRRQLCIEIPPAALLFVLPCCCLRLFRVLRVLCRCYKLQCLASQQIRQQCTGTGTNNVGRQSLVPPEQTNKQTNNKDKKTRTGESSTFVCSSTTAQWQTTAVTTYLLPQKGNTQSSARFPNHPMSTFQRCWSDDTQKQRSVRIQIAKCQTTQNDVCV